MPPSIAVIGECMLELTHAAATSAQTTPQGSLPMSMGYGGDTLNTSIYLARNDIEVSYITALGDDTTSDWLIDQWTSEGVDCSLVTRMPNSVPGMYMINVDDQGERSFLYWRKHSPASRLFDEVDVSKAIFESLSRFPYVYLSGISLAILSEESCLRLIHLLSEYRANGGKIIFDGNYREKLWSSTYFAQNTYRAMYQITDIALPTLEDEAELFGFDNAQQVLEAIKQLGVQEIVVKMGGEGCITLHDDSIRQVSATMVKPVDTTAAGDSFNAGYLAARFKGQSGLEACNAGHALASQVIQYKGAIMR